MRTRARLAARVIAALLAGAAASAGFGAAAAPAAGAGGPVPLAPVGLSVDGSGHDRPIATAQPTFSFVARDPAAGSRTSAYEIQVLHGDTVLLDATRSSDDTVHVPYGGPDLQSGEAYAFRVRTRDRPGDGGPADAWGPWSQTTSFEVGLLGQSAWHGARWLELPDITLLRKDFALPAGAIAKARLYVVARGTYQPHLNGGVVDPTSVLDGAETDYGVRALAQTFDVTSQLHPGARNTVGFSVARGISLRGDQGLNVGSADTGTQDSVSRHPWLGARLAVTYADGSSFDLVTDGSWLIGTSPTSDDYPWMGDVYDARAEQPGWDGPGFDATAWAPATQKDPVGAPADGTVAPDPVAPMRIVDTIKPVSTTTLPSGAVVYDFGRNITGWPVLSGTATLAGQTVILHAGEILTPDGRVSTRNITLTQTETNDRQSYRYTFAGRSGGETWAPTFAYSGFRYLEVSGSGPSQSGRNEQLPGELPPLINNLSVVAQEIHTDDPQTGHFVSCDSRIDAILTAYAQTERNAQQGIPLDCPTREKKGWLGDAAVTSAASMDLFNGEDLWGKWLGDIASSQGSDGTIWAVAPCRALPCGPFMPDPNWSEALPVVLWQDWLHYGDARLLVRYRPNLERWLGWMAAHAQRDGTINMGSFGDDWQAVETTGHPELQTGAYLDGLDVAAKVAAILGDESGANTWRARFQQVAAAFNADFWQRSIRAYGTSQAANAYPLSLGIVPAERYATTVAELVNSVKSRDAITGGFVGQLRIYQALHRIGRDDLLVDVAHSDAYPGFGYMLKQGPGTIWERFTCCLYWSENGPTDVLGYQGRVGTGSKDHPGLGGGFGQWALQGLGGIEPTGPAYRTVLIAPAFNAGPQCAHTSVDTPRGTIRADWERTSAGYQLNVTIPENVVANITLPLERLGAQATERGGDIASTPGVLSARTEADTVTVTATNGHFEFEVGDASHSRAPQ